MALWKARALSPEQKVRIVEEESDTKNLQVSEEDSMGKNLQETDEETESKSLLTEESGSFLGVGDVSMSLVYSSVLSIPVGILHLQFNMLQILQHSALVLIMKSCLLVIFRLVSLWSYLVVMTLIARSWRELVVLIILAALGNLKNLMCTKDNFITNLINAFLVTEEK